MVRPDFLAWRDNLRVIVDAKYKNLATQRASGADEDNQLGGDVYQMLVYSRHRAVKRTFAPAPPNEPTALVLCYPPGSSDDALTAASRALKAALSEEHPAVYRRFCDFDVPVLLVGLPVPTA